MGPMSSPLASGEPSARLGRAQDGRAVAECVRVCRSPKIARLRSLNRTSRTRGPPRRAKAECTVKSRFRNPVLIEDLAVVGPRDSTVRVPDRDPYSIVIQLPQLRPPPCTPRRCRRLKHRDER